MQLRTRITLLVALGFLALMAAFLVASMVRDRLEHERLSALAISDQTALWNAILAVQLSGLDRAMAGLEALPQALEALARGDEPAFRAEVAAHGDAEDVAGLYLELVGEDREILFTSGPASGRGILDAGTLDRVMSGRGAGGMRAVSAEQVLVAAARPVKLPGRGQVVLVLARDARMAISRFAASLDANAAFLSRRGRLMAASNDAFWRQAGLVLSPRVALYEHVAVGAQTYAVTVIPVEDLAGGSAGAIVSLKNVTAEWEAQTLLRHTSIAIGMGLALVVLVGLNAFLWHSFRPLENAIGVLQALSRGDTSVALNHSGTDEIGRIAQAVVGLRANAQALAESRRQRERIRRRQESVISFELKSLADAIDPTGREEVLALLERSDTRDNEDELRRVARVLHDLSRRIIEQHTRLSAMVVELREALVTKTKLAGLQQELEIARQVQAAILPKAFPPNPRVELDGHMTPAREVGGDFYDYFLIDDTSLGFVVADVSGKGVPAALFMAISRTLLHATALFDRSPAHVVRRLNDLLAVENDQMFFVTLFYGVLDLQTGRIRYVNAGHNPPYKIARDGAVSILPTTRGMAVAVMEGFIYAEGEVQLEPGDTVFMFTDGVTEAFDVDDQPYGDARLEALMKADMHRLAVPDVARAVMASVHAFERGAPHADDITCLTLRYLGGQDLRGTH